MELRVLAHFFVRDKLQRVPLIDRRGDFSEVAAFRRIDFDLRITWNIDRVVAIELECLAFGSYGRSTVKINQSDLMIFAIELDWRIAGCDRDAAIVQVTGSGRARSDRGAT